jgi:hypothetical protein
MLLPLLPIIHADREPDSKGNLRSLLVPAIVQLLLAPHIRPLAPLGSAQALQHESRLKVLGCSSVRKWPSWERLCRHHPDVAAALQAQDAAGESLQDRLTAILAALLPGGWASWLRGGQNKRLRDVAAFEGSRALQEDLDKLLQQQAAGGGGGAVVSQDSGISATARQQLSTAGRASSRGSSSAAPAADSSFAAPCLTPGVRLRLQGALPPTQVQMRYIMAGCRSLPASLTAGEEGQDKTSAAASRNMMSNSPLSVWTPSTPSAWTPLPLESLPLSQTLTSSSRGNRAEGSHDLGAVSALSSAAPSGRTSRCSGGLQDMVTGTLPGSSIQLMCLDPSRARPHKQSRYA